MKQKKRNNSPFAQLKACREKAGLTQAQLGNLVGVSKDQIYLYENGKSQPRPGSLRRKELLAFIEKWKDEQPESSFDLLKTCREKAGLTQVQLAEMVGVIRSQIYQYENGKAQPRPGSLHRKELLAFIEKWKDEQPESSFDLLKTCREKAGLTQQELAEMVGVLQIRICQYENGKAQPRPGSLHRKELLAFIEEWKDRAPHPPFAQLKACREKAGLTQVQLAEMVGLSAEQISTYESGVYEPRRGSLHRKELLAFIDEWKDEQPESSFFLLKACREKAGLTQEELADMVGVPQYLICHYEKGRTQSEPDLTNRKKLLAFIEGWQDKVPHSPFAELKACRKKAGLTQAQLAEMVGVSHLQICKYEKKGVQPKKNSPQWKKLLAFIDEYRS
jgi:transcriptional regulator with XRE-family HTH domain